VKNGKNLYPLLMGIGLHLFTVLRRVAVFLPVLRKPVGRWQLLAVVFLAFTPVLPADEESESFLKEYVPSSRKLIDFYEHVTMEADCSFSAISSDGKEERRKHYHILFKAGAPFYLVQIYNQEDEEAGITGATEIYLFGRRKGYSLLSVQPEQPYHITNMWDRTPENDATLYIGEALFAFIPYCWFDLRIPDMLRYPYLTVLRIQKYKENNQERVDLWYQVKGPSPIDYTGKMVFSPSNSWALLSRVAYQGEKPKNRYDIIYDDLSKEVPWLKKVAYWQQNDGGSVIQKTWTIRRLVPGPVPEEEFTLAAYGVTEPVERPSVFFLLFWLALAVLFLTILARLLHYLWKKQRTLPAA
jgi:hypothetical protein